MVGQIARHRQFAAVERGIAQAMDAVLGDELQVTKLRPGADDDLTVDNAHYPATAWKRWNIDGSTGATQWRRVHGAQIETAILDVQAGKPILWGR